MKNMKEEDQMKKEDEEVDWREWKIEEKDEMRNMMLIDLNQLKVELMDKEELMWSEGDKPHK